MPKLFPTAVKDEVLELYQKHGPDWRKIFGELGQTFPQLEPGEPDPRTIKRWIKEARIRSEAEEDQRGSEAEEAQANLELEEAQANLELEEAQVSSEAEGEAPEAGPAACSGSVQHSQAYEDLSDIQEMEWTLDELQRRHVPTKEARKLLKSYFGLVNHPTRMFAPLKDDPLFRTLCFQVKLHQDYPNIPTQKVHVLARCYYLGPYLAPRRLIDEALASESREPRKPWIERFR